MLRKGGYWIAAVGLAMAWMGAAGQVPRTVLMDGGFLAKERVSPGPGVVQAVRAEADEALQAPVHSVMEKTQVPPSGDKHDYMSLAPYFWPNPKTPNHLPYVRRDGQNNPETKDFPDHENFSTMARNVHALAEGYFFTGEARYAQRASLLVHVWFLDEATKMNPRLPYAQAIKGVNDGRGIGILDVRWLAHVVDGLAMLEGSKYWTTADDEAMHGWLGAYYLWLTTSKNGNDEHNEKNNHGSWFDVQTEAIALYLGKMDAAKTIAETAKVRRIGLQIEADGQQPMEEARTNSFGYACFNVTALTRLAVMSEGVGVDLWGYRSEKGGSIQAALDFLVPYGLKQKRWERETIKGFHAGELRTPLLLAAVAYKNAEYEAAAMKIPGHDDVEALLLEREYKMMQKTGAK